MEILWYISFEKILKYGFNSRIAKIKLKSQGKPFHQKNSNFKRAK